MSLHNPGPGEILDRLTILALKITHGKLRGVDTAHWAEEDRHLRHEFKAEGLNEPFTAAHTFELAAVNGALWAAEDTLRRLRDTLSYEGLIGDLARVAIQIQTLNDRRATLITLLNAAAGLSRPQEKL